VKLDNHHHKRKVLSRKRKLATFPVFKGISVQPDMRKTEQKNSKEKLAKYKSSQPAKTQSKRKASTQPTAVPSTSGGITRADRKRRCSAELTGSHTSKFGKSDELIDVDWLSASTVRIGHLNVNALTNKINLVSNLIHEHSIDVLCLTETKVDSNVTLINFPGYELVRKDRSASGGGVAILIRQEYKYSLKVIDAIENSSSNLESITLQVQVRKLKSILITCLYRPKFTLSCRDVGELEKVFVELDQSNRIFCCLGDFNIHLEKSDRPEIIRFNHMLSRNCLSELIQEPTRMNARLDLAITNNLIVQGIKSTVVQEAISDHNAIMINIPIRLEKKKPIKITIRNFKQINWERFGNLTLQSFDSEIDSSSLDFAALR
jgi:hypothetical protein